MIGSGDNSGNNAIGSSIGFAPPNPTRLSQRKAAIASVQTSGDQDHIGLSFYTHQNDINFSDMRESMRLNHQGYLGINTNAPSAYLDVVGSFQYSDGNEASGRVLSSDANGNASWTNIGTLFTDTDDQTIDLFSFNSSTNILSLAIEDDGIADQTVDLSSLDTDDADWYQVGTTNAPNNNTDDIYTSGSVGIGDSSPDATLDIEATTSDLEAIQLNYTYTGTSTPAKGIHIISQTSGSAPNIYGAYIQTYNSSSATTSTAVYAFNPATSTNNRGLRALATGAGTDNIGVLAEANDGSAENTGGDFYPG